VYRFKKNLAMRLVISLLLITPTSPALLQGQAASKGTSSEDTTSATTEKPKSNTSRKKRNSSEQPSNRNRSHTSSKTEASGNASDSQIAAAKSSGKVWVNLDSGIYHKSGRWYGRTKNGKFMTEAEAKAAGYKTSQRN
jgi:hypothetical protein